MNRPRTTTTLLSLLLLWFATPANAQSGAAVDPATFYRDAAIADVDAAASLLERNHPGAAPELADAEFRRSLAEAHALARQRAPTVTTAGGYFAVMHGFSNMLEDKHLSFKPALSIARPEWVGLIMALRNGEWVVADEDNWPGRDPLVGATLESCDGIPVEQLARERLGGFRAEWSIQAQRGLAAPWLLVDEHNPFLEPLEECVFQTASGPRAIEMDWRPVSRDSIISRMTKAAGRGAAGYGVRRAGEGWWISIGEFTAKAPAVIERARSLQAELRASPFIIFDVRGNGGGASDLGDQLAQVLYGDDAIPADNGCPTVWRVSTDNLARLGSYPRLLGDRLSPSAKAMIASQIDAMRDAMAAGEPFSRPLRACGERPAPTVSQTPRVFILTDRVCFSSCLLVVQRFRELGAVQIGEATNGNTHYYENRREPLPSGLGTIGIQATVDLSEPARIGPFEADIAYPGDLTDTQAVEAWVLANVGAWTRGNSAGTGTRRGRTAENDD